LPRFEAKAARWVRLQADGDPDAGR
jgi:hypothetical protein